MPLTFPELQRSEDNFACCKIFSLSKQTNGRDHSSPSEILRPEPGPRRKIIPAYKEIRALQT